MLLQCFTIRFLARVGQPNRGKLGLSLLCCRLPARGPRAELLAKIVGPAGTYDNENRWLRLGGGSRVELRAR